MGELIVILIVALLFLGPEKLPDAAKTISKGIRDFRKQTRELQESLEGDEEIGSAIRDLKSALRGDEISPPRTQHARARPPQPEQLAGAGNPDSAAHGDSADSAGNPGKPDSPGSADESAPDDDMPVIRPPSGTVTRSAAPHAATSESAASERPGGESPAAGASDVAGASDSASTAGTSDSEEAHG